MGTRSSLERTLGWGHRVGSHPSLPRAAAKRNSARDISTPDLRIAKDFCKGLGERSEISKVISHRSQRPKEPNWDLISAVCLPGLIPKKAPSEFKKINKKKNFLPLVV